MDSLTHVYFAWRLAEVSGTDPGSAYAALFPQIDRNPPYFHRLYAHNFALARELGRIGQEVMATGKIPPRFKDNYAWKRFLEERPRIVAYREKFAEAAGVSLPPPGTDVLSGATGYLSHIYFDTYNQPVQASRPGVARADGFHPRERRPHDPAHARVRPHETAPQAVRPAATARLAGGSRRCALCCRPGCDTSARASVARCGIGGTDGWDNGLPRRDRTAPATASSASRPPPARFSIRRFRRTCTTTRCTTSHSCGRASTA